MSFAIQCTRAVLLVGFATLHQYTSPHFETMAIRILNLILLLATLCGFYFVWQARGVHREVEAEYRRLIEKVERMPIEDETKVHVKAIDQDQPLSYAWHVFVPANYSMKHRVNTSSGSSGGTSYGSREADRYLFRVRFRKIDDVWHVWTKWGSGSGRMSFPATQGKVLDHPERLQVERAAASEMRVYDPDEIVDLLRIEADQSDSDEQSVQLLLSVRFGSVEAWEKKE